MYGDVRPVKNLQGTLTYKQKLEGSVSNDLVLEGEVTHPSYIYKTLTDYERLDNLPKINHEEVIGDKPLEAYSLRAIYYDSVANWNNLRDLVSEEGAIYIYKDAETVYINDAGVPAPGIKVGDGTSYLIDLPFIDDYEKNLIIYHIQNTDIHITAAEREFWNNKVTCFLDVFDEENIVFSKDGILDG